MKPETAKNLGGAGALLLVISGLGIYGFARYTGLLGQAGIVLLFIALKGMADHYGEPGIFRNAIYSVVTVARAVAHDGSTAALGLREPPHFHPQIMYHLLSCLRILIWSKTAKRSKT